MTDHRSRRTEHHSHLQVVGPETTPAPADEDPARRAWARAQALRDELERLRAGDAPTVPRPSDRGPAAGRPRLGRWPGRLAGRRRQVSGGRLSVLRATVDAWT